MSYSAPTVASRSASPASTDRHNNERRVEGWALGSLLADSALASIYAARPAESPPPLGYPYAIKLLNPRWQQSELALAMFTTEAHVGRRVVHPNLVSVLFARTTAVTPYLVMPRYEGRTLASLTRAGERLPLTTGLWMLRQAADALTALHSSGWLHGDIKPHNLLIDEHGHATLLDLGFVRPIDQPIGIADRPVTGTLRYIAPEMIRSSLRADERSDIYSLGVVAYELLTGRPPFTGRSAADLAQQHCHERPPEICRFAPATPLAVRRLVETMLAKEPLRRPESMRAVVESLVKLEIESFGEETGYLDAA